VIAAEAVEPALAPAEAQPAEPVEAVAPPSAVQAPATAAPAAPVRIEPFVLPTEALQSIAGAAGLEWVNSDAEKIRAVQAAMAAEPKPIHVPREPRPPVVIDEGPLVLVETRKDLSQLRLPFEAAGR
jgi:ribonuclease E